MRNIRINIVGAGAVGHLWYCYLQESKHTVRIFSRSKRSSRELNLINAHREKSVKIQYLQLDQWQPADLILICVKAYQLDELGKNLAQIVSKECPVILMMNGMGLVETISPFLPENPIFHAYLTHGAYLTKDSVVHAGIGVTSIGTLNDSPQPEQTNPFLEILNDALPPVSWSDNHKEDMFKKLFINAVINPLTAISKQLNGSILADGHLNAEAQALINEFRPLIAHLLPRISVKEIQSVIEKVAKDTANNRSSMLQDIQAGRRTEIDFINGYLVELSSKLNIDLPLNINIINQIKTLE